eukprot:1740698-Rhodomonas_salina.2
MEWRSTLPSFRAGPGQLRLRRRLWPSCSWLSSPSSLNQLLHPLSFPWPATPDARNLTLEAACRSQKPGREKRERKRAEIDDKGCTRTALSPSVQICRTVRCSCGKGERKKGRREGRRQGRGDEPKER